jgi:phosphoenolpyruvate carboxylase
MSDTPRSDAAKAAYIREALPITNIFLPMQEMERELNAVRHQLKQARDTIDAYEDKWIDEHV